MLSITGDNARSRELSENGYRPGRTGQWWKPIGTLRLRPCACVLGGDGDPLLFWVCHRVPSQFQEEMQFQGHVACLAFGSPHSTRCAYRSTPTLRSSPLPALASVARA